MERKPSRDQIRSQAAAWVVRLDGAATDADREAFAAWRAAGAGHDLAFEREKAAWERMDRLTALNAPAQDADLLRRRAPAPWRRVVGLLPAPSRWMAAAGTVAAIATVSALLVRSDPAYATGIGETRLLTLPDQSRVQLNTNSAIVVHYSKGRRRIELVRGEMFVQIDGNDLRPFVVSTAAGEIRPEAGRLDVRLHDDGMIVDAIQGVSHVALEGVAATVEPGMRGTFDGGRIRAAAIDPSQTLAWRQGAIDLRGQTLREAADEFNRYNMRQIVIADPDIASYRLGGYFQTSDVAGFVRAVRTAFPVEAKAAGDDIELRRRAG